MNYANIIAASQSKRKLWKRAIAKHIGDSEARSALPPRALVLRGESPALFSNQTMRTCEVVCGILLARDQQLREECVESNVTVTDELQQSQASSRESFSKRKSTGHLPNVHLHLGKEIVARRHFRMRTLALGRIRLAVRQSSHNTRTARNKAASNDTLAAAKCLQSSRPER